MNFKIHQIGRLVVNISTENIFDTSTHQSLAQGESVINSPNIAFTNRQYVYENRTYTINGTLDYFNNRLTPIVFEQKLKRMIGGTYSIIAYIVEENNLSWVESTCSIQSVSVFESDGIQPQNIEFNIVLLSNWKPLDANLYSYGSHENYTSDGDFTYEYFREEIFDIWDIKASKNTSYNFHKENIFPDFPGTEIIGAKHIYGFSKKPINAPYKMLQIHEMPLFKNSFYNNTNYIGNWFGYYDYKTSFGNTAIKRTFYADPDFWNGLPNVLFKITNLSSDPTSLLEGIVTITNTFLNDNGSYDIYRTQIDIGKTYEKYDAYATSFGDPRTSTGAVYSSVEEDAYICVGNFRFVDEDNKKNIGTDLFYRPYQKVYTYNIFGLNGKYVPNLGSLPIVYDDVRLDISPELEYEGFWPFFILPGENNIEIEITDANTDFEIYYSIIPTMV